MSLVAAFLFLAQCFFIFGEALICYECTTLQGQSCYDPIYTKDIKAVDCRNSSYIIGNQENAQYQCVVYLDRYKNNHTNVIRKCVRKNDMDYCAVHKDDAEKQGFTVEKCEACCEDYCNTGYRLENWHIINFLIFVVYLKIGL